MRRINSILMAAALVLAGGSVSAWEEQKALDFITGGGWFIIQEPALVAQPGTRANFGWHGGVKNGDWWGNGNYVDHGTGLHARSLFVTGYLKIGEDGGTHPRLTGTRDICGRARTNIFGDLDYTVRMRDSGEPGRQDRFGIALYDDSGNLVYFAWGRLGDFSPGGGNIQLHRGNDSNTLDPSKEPNCRPFPFEFPD